MVYAIERVLNTLVGIGGAKLESNGFYIQLRDDALARFARGEFRPFVLVGPQSMSAWPAIPNVAALPPKTRLWANVKGKLANRRTQTWEGWPIRAGANGLEIAEQPRGDQAPVVLMVLLKPLVSIEKLITFEPKHDGFLLGFKEGAEPSQHEGGYRERLDMEQGSEGSSQEGEALPGEDDHSGKVGRDRPTRGRVHRHSDDADGRGSHRAEQSSLAFDHPATCLPEWTIETHGPSPGLIKIRIGAGVGIQGLKEGDPHEAERCPALEGAVWVRAPNGVGYRLLPGQWVAATVRKARAL